MKQVSFAQAEYQNKKKQVRRERFLNQMVELVPWQRLQDAQSPVYVPGAAGRRGRPPIGLERMLRTYFLQQWYALADEALKDAIYNSQAMRDFVGIDLAVESVPDATTLPCFRHLLEAHALTQRIFGEINALHIMVKCSGAGFGIVLQSNISCEYPENIFYVLMIARGLYEHQENTCSDGSRQTSNLSYPDVLADHVSFIYGFTHRDIWACIAHVSCRRGHYYQFSHCHRAAALKK